MKPVGPVVLLLAGLVLGWIALSAEDPSFAVDRPREAPESVPYTLSGHLPPGCVVRALEVDGICCTGCAGKLFLALTDVEEVREVAIDPVLERAEAVVPASLDVAVLEQALTFDKYSAQAAE